MAHTDGHFPSLKLISDLSGTATYRATVCLSGDDPRGLEIQAGSDITGNTIGMAGLQKLTDIEPQNLGHGAMLNLVLSHPKWICWLFVKASVDTSSNHELELTGYDLGSYMRMVKSAMEAQVVFFCPLRTTSEPSPDSAEKLKKSREARIASGLEEQATRRKEDILKQLQAERAKKDDAKKQQ